MAGVIDTTSLQVARSTRLSVFADFQAAVQRIDREEELLKRSLRESAPASVSRLLKEEDIIGDLFKYGKSGRTLYYDDNPYKLKNARQVKAAFAELRQAWRNAVIITFSEETHRIKYTVSIP